MVHLITGYAGEEHIQSADDGAFNASFFGEGQFIMEQGGQFEASIVNNNTIRVLDGNGLMYGRHFRVNPNTYEDITIETGTAGTNRFDLIVMTYKKDANEGTESCYFEVVKGTEASVNPQVPSYTDGNILEGATFNQMPMFKVTIEGVVLSNVETLFRTIPTYKSLAEQYEEEFVEACQTHLDSLNILDSMEEIEANEQEDQIAGALAVKEGFEQTNESIDALTDDINIRNVKYSGGKLYYKDGSTWKEIQMNIKYNYSSPVYKMTANGVLNWTVTEDCYLVGTVACSTASPALLSVNGNPIAWCYCYSQSGVAFRYGSPHFEGLPLKSGDVISTDKAVEFKYFAFYKAR